MELKFKPNMLKVNASPRYLEDALVNGIKDDENNPKMPLMSNGRWKPIIDIDSGIIHDWPAGTTASVHYKVCDECGWSIYDGNGTLLLYAEDGYVPDSLCPNEDGYGDYIKMDIDEIGKIKNWKFDISDFL